MSETPVITRDMIDYEADGSVTVTTANGTRYRVELLPDLDITPFDSDCYDDEDIEAWREDRWEYVSVVVTPLGTLEVDQFELSDSLSGVEFGSHVWNRGTEHEGAITVERIVTQYPVPDMIGELERRIAVYRARTTEHLGALLVEL